jgi:hypothetical protein
VGKSCQVKRRREDSSKVGEEPILKMMNDPLQG